MTDRHVRGGASFMPTAPVIIFCGRHGPTPGLTRLSGLSTPANVTSNPFAANEVHAFPFLLTAPMTTIYKGFWVNGTSAGSNSSMAIYDADFRKIVETASTGGTGASQPQIVTMSAKLPPGLYYAALAHSSATNSRFFAWTLGTLGDDFYKMAGCWKQASITVGSLPATATPAAITSVSFPAFGLITRTSFDV